jgi:acetyl-CoA carboxylase carboxyltransferase component
LVSTDDPNRRVPELAGLIPAQPEKPYDIRQLIEAVVDERFFFEIHKDYAANIVVGFAFCAAYSTSDISIIGSPTSTPTVPHTAHGTSSTKPTEFVFDAFYGWL